ncbi:MAG: AAA family ATPase [Thioclava marina]|jgi:ATP-dependent Zn proteases|uniref:AAA family ATPase n=1 Tax=Thioclava marina TaxID=1915077 RepID=UPI001996A715|nr:AAA family ATPase [Thioclava marina]MBC7147611.1 AAA family ATPase [Thioclava marina]
MTQNNFSPIWAPLALEAVMRLRDAWLARLSPAEPETSSELDDSYAPGFDDFDTFPTESSAPPLPGQVLPPGQLLLTLRLAASFVTAERIAELSAPGNVTLLGGASAEDMKTAREVLEKAFLPRVAKPVGKLHHLPEAFDQLSLQIPGQSRQIPVSDELRQAVETRNPLLLLIPEDVQLPRDIFEILPDPLPLAPASRQIALVQLVMTYTEATDFDALEAALPDDAAFTSISPAAYAMAFRAPTAETALARLVSASELRRVTSGPSLDGLVGTSAGVSVAKRMVADLADWRSGRVEWTEVTRSVLFYGPPGTGKTWLARAMGTAAGVTFVTASFAEWQACGHLGDMLAAMHRSFAEAKAAAPSIMFIDETDAAGSRHGGDRHGKSYRRQVITGFLTEIDALARTEGVLLVGATNDIGALDPAILRPGRFDLHVEIPLPGLSVLENMLRARLDFPADDVRALARAAVGQSPAELDAAIRAAQADARSAGRSLRPSDLRARIAARHFDDPEHDRRVALHECGHAIVTTELHLGRTTRLLLSPRGGEAHNEILRPLDTIADVESEMTSLLAGRAAESLILGEASVGAGGGSASDLAKATRHALDIETRYGLGHHQLVWLDEPDHLTLRNPHVYGRVRQRLTKAEARAREILQEHRATLVTMAQELTEKRELNIPDLERWLGTPTTKTVGKAKNATAPEPPSPPQQEL